MSSPVLTWRDTNGNALSSLTFTGSGSGGTIPLGTISSVQMVRLYNNYASASGIADAVNVNLTVYDDAFHQGLAVLQATQQFFIQMQVTDYNGQTIGADSQWYGVGGATKHVVPVNGGILAGNVANYMTIGIRVNAPTSATVTTINQAIWAEYSTTA